MKFENKFDLLNGELVFKGIQSLEKLKYNFRSLNAFCISGFNRVQFLLTKGILLLFPVFFIVFSAASQSQIDSLLRLSANATEKQKSALYLEMSQKVVGDTAKSNSYIWIAYHIAREQKLIPEQSRAFFYLGENSYNSFDYLGALNWYNKALPLFQSLNDSVNTTNCFKSIGLCYYSLYQNEKAIAQFYEGIKYCVRDTDNTAKLVYNIAKTHLRMGNKNAAANNFRLAVSLNNSTNNLSGIAANYNGLGITFKNVGRLDSALYYYYLAHRIYKKIKRKDNMAIALSNIAGIYLNYPDSINKSIEYYNQAWSIFQEIGWNQYEAEIRQGIGFALYKQGKYKQAINNYLQSLDVNDKYRQGYQIKTTNYDLLSRTYEKMNDYKTALKYNKLYIQYSDSLHQKEKLEKIITLEKNYEVQKKENEILKLHAKQELTNIELIKNKQLKQLGFVTIVLLLVFVFFMLKKYSDKLKSNMLLEEKNQIINKSEQELRLLNAAKNKFFSIIAHDLKNPFHTVMGYSWLLSKDYDRFTEQERRKFALDIHNSSNNIFRLLQNLLEWSKSQTGRLTFTPLEVEFKRVLENSLSVSRLLAEQKNINLKIDYESELKIFADPLMIETVLRNLINNAIKFTPENGSIEIQAREIEDQVSISVNDSGIGISDEDIKNLFRIDSKVKRKGTNGEDGSGLGLILCQEFIEKNNGNIWATSTPGNGSTFIFTIPAKAIA